MTDNDAPISRPGRLLTAGVAIAGCLLITVAATPQYTKLTVLTADISQRRYDGYADMPTMFFVWLFLPVLAALLSLLFVRWWPYLVLVGGLLTLPALLAELDPAPNIWPLTLYAIAEMAPTLLLVGVLGGAQALARAGSMGLAAAVAACGFGAEVLAAVLVGDGPIRTADLSGWHIGLTVVGLLGAALGVWRFPRGDGARHEPGGRWSRWRFAIVGALVVAVPIPLGILDLDTLARLTGVNRSSLLIHEVAVTATFGVTALVLIIGLTAAAGVWTLAGSLIAGLVQAALTVPMILVVWALAVDRELGWMAALVGVALGATAAASRWRTALAAGATVTAAIGLFAVYSATGGDPAKVAVQRQAVIGALLLVVLAAAATATIGATVPTLSRSVTVALALGPVAAALAVAGRQVVRVTYDRDRGGSQTGYGYLSSVNHLTTSALLLLVAAAGLGGLGLAHLLASRRADRKLAEAIAREAAEAERNRLARPIHDGVLQVLSLVQRHGPELGERGTELAELAGMQEVALRTLISSGPADAGPAAELDLYALVAGLRTPAVDVSGPAEPVLLPGHAASELYAAVAASVDNVRRHAGPGARAWILVERDPDGVRVTVRDDGIGMPAGRPDEAAAAGRLGVAQSMRGRIADLGGTTTIVSHPGEGTEVEFWLPVR